MSHCRNALSLQTAEYIKFCEDTTLQAQTVCCFPNNKPWINRDMKMLLNKKQAFRSGNKDQLKRELRIKLRQVKDKYRRPNFSKTG